MNILVVSNMYPSAKDPAYGTFVKCFVEYFTKLNLDGETNISVVKGRDGGKIKRLIRYLIFFLKTVYLLLFKNYDIVYVHTITHPILPIKVVSLIKKLPLVFNVHGGDVLTQSISAEYLKEIARPLLKDSLMIVSPSKYFKEVILTEFPEINKNKIFVSPSGGIDLDLFKPSPICENRIFTIGFVSRISNKKGWDLFVNLINTLKQNNINCKGIIVGRGDQQASLISLITKLNLDNDISYRGAVSHDDLPQVYSDFDLFIFPTCLHESLGLVGLEAMACGIPIIGSNIGGLKDYIIQDTNGYKFEVNNLSDLELKVMKYISLSEHDKEKFKKNAILTALEYDSKNVSITLFNKLNSLIHKL